MNEKVLSTLEYTKIAAMLESRAASQLGKAAAAALRPAEGLPQAQTQLKQTCEADTLYRRTGRSPVDAFPDIRPLTGRMKAALAISAGELLSVAAVLRVSREARNALSEGEGEGLLNAMANYLSSHRSVEEEIARCILSEDEIADSASPELGRIRRQMKLIGERVRDKLNNMIKSPQMQKYLQEPIITMRNGRYALPVKAEYRTLVPGLVHDQSGSGATLFVEPASVVELGNEIKRLLSEEQTEIERILSGLTALAAPYADELYNACNVLAALDVIFAKAILARDMDAHCPTLTGDGKLKIVRGRHPLLDPATVVPVDIWLGEEFTTLIITGPNTGGKTVTLKTVGLLTLMAMSGLFVPADEGTRLSVFQEVFADIGDEQSIEQSLSTFSSHMKNNVAILAQADKDSLVLLDELGAGTDPVEGAALAQAILETLYQRKARCVATTHYSEIKAFALTHSGMQNASMEFDVNRLCPTYRLFIGIPGKSNAFEISRRLGLSDEVIHRAETYLEKTDVAFETVLAEAEQARKSAEEDRDAARQDRYDAQRMKTEWEKRYQKLEDEKALLRQKAREDARNTVSETRREMEQLIVQLRSVKNIDHKELERAVQKTRDQMRASEEKLYEQSRSGAMDGEAPDTVTPGQQVQLVHLGQNAAVLKGPDARGEVQVQAGIVKMTVNLKDLRPLPQTKKKEKTASKVTLSTERGKALELDIRGMTVDEGMMEIDRFIDNATFTGVQEFFVIHGKGTGALRSGVQTFLRNHPKVKSYRMGAYGEGDAGVTVVTLK
jgi:DNA mismatch repair protein MutS2